MLLLGVYSIMQHVHAVVNFSQQFFQIVLEARFGVAQDAGYLWLARDGRQRQVGFGSIGRMLLADDGQKVVDHLNHFNNLSLWRVRILKFSNDEAEMAVNEP